VGDRVRLVPEGTEPDLAFDVLRVEPSHLLLGPGTRRSEAIAAIPDLVLRAAGERSWEHPADRALPQ